MEPGGGPGAALKARAGCSLTRKTSSFHCEKLELMTSPPRAAWIQNGVELWQEKSKEVDPGCYQLEKDCNVPDLNTHLLTRRHTKASLHTEHFPPFGLAQFQCPDTES